jgi:hypothetical protein
MAMLMRRISGETYGEIGDHFGVTPQAAHAMVGRTAQRHVREVLLQMWTAQKGGEILVLVIPAGYAKDQAAATSYLAFIVRALNDLGADVEVIYRPTPEGHIAFGLEDRDFTRKLMEAAR